MWEPHIVNIFCDICIKEIDNGGKSKSHFTKEAWKSLVETFGRETGRAYEYNKLKNDCIGAIDGVHVPVCISPLEAIPYIGRKGIPTQNVMAACDFDMRFTFCWAGWEGSAHDTRIFYAVLRDPTLNFPHPPDGNLYNL
ncbi:Myb_DNA-bind_3 domain-containing protein/DDE_4 domain-containing protein [Cephalotus follicularis]|uniref:Myb_DNA-bind_3 domain-containing protein/DDE_4 domain-containing protein n=1 Tax=Cephalotus follicularis TaxID=3775 RepID=A0A1Q3CB13_CEPFO|nr:Myb_DNA-bind_3 domain-containing protein/DDE_4 domain-containing protein [Cephalotus follicularis]